VGDFFENFQRRDFWPNHRFGTDQECLLQCVLAGQDGVRDGVCVDHPRGARGELERVFGTGGLEVRILFQEIVEAHHEVVVGGALDGGNGGAESDGAAGSLADAGKRGAGVGRDFFGSKLADSGSEGVADDPVARARGIDVVKEAQNAGAIRGARGESVGVEKVITAAEREVAVLFFLGAEARVVELPVLLIGREEEGEELDDGVGVAAHDALQALDGGGIGCFGVEAAKAIDGGFVGDVFVERAVRLLLTEKEAGVVCAERDGGLREVEDVTGFKLGAEGAGLIGGGGERGGRDGDDCHDLQCMRRAS
jgi:hypothetical protein